MRMVGLLDEHDCCHRGAHGAEEVVQSDFAEESWEWSRDGGYTVQFADVTGGEGRRGHACSIPGPCGHGAHRHHSISGRGQRWWGQLSVAASQWLPRLGQWHIEQLRRDRVNSGRAKERRMVQDVLVLQ